MLIPQDFAISSCVSPARSRLLLIAAASRSRDIQHTEKDYFVPYLVQMGPFWVPLLMVDE
ncbi:hypothetical protein [Vibrio injensis]|uniref:hypothetical protein n=1 Tax=Vibrio injensis TaxID=1307414 RepID=UPI00278C46D7|nr:hypothetical protein [Vibrio injensis]